MSSSKASNKSMVLDSKKTCCMSRRKQRIILEQLQCSSRSSFPPYQHKLSSGWKSLSHNFFDSKRYLHLPLITTLCGQDGVWAPAPSPPRSSRSLIRDQTRLTRSAIENKKISFSSAFSSFCVFMSFILCGIATLHNVHNVHAILHSYPIFCVWMCPAPHYFWTNEKWSNAV